MSLIRSFSDHQLVVLQDDEWLERQRIAGRSVVFCLNSARAIIDSRLELNVSTLKAEIILLMRGFNCTQVLVKDHSHRSSVNIYNSSFNKMDDSYKFQDGDLIILEIACAHSGAVAKSTISLIKGQPKSSDCIKMLQACKKALDNSINQIENGKKIGCIGSGINHIIKSTSFKIVPNHYSVGLDFENTFSDPIILNKSQSNYGITIQKGMTFAISPAISLNDGSLNCCFEKTIFVHENKVEIITPWE